MRKIEKLLPSALAAATKLKIAKEGENKGKISKQFNGYISSFAASIINAGLLSSIMFYSQSKEKTEAEREKLIEAIEYILKSESSNILKSNDSLIKVVEELIKNNNTEKVSRLKAEILYASTALKLAIRTFPKTKN